MILKNIKIGNFFVPLTGRYKNKLFNKSSVCDNGIVHASPYYHYIPDGIAEREGASELLMEHPNKTYTFSKKTKVVPIIIPILK